MAKLIWRLWKASVTWEERKLCRDERIGWAWEGWDNQDEGEDGHREDGTRTKKWPAEPAWAGWAAVSWLSGSQLKWQLDQMRLGSAQIGASSGSGSSRWLAGATATLGTAMIEGWCLGQHSSCEPLTLHRKPRCRGLPFRRPLTMQC